MRKHSRLLGPLLAAVIAFLASLPGSAFAITYSNMYVFGDSLSDNGNLYAWTGNPNPITGGIPIPISNPPFYSPGRFQNGPSYSELLWDQLGLAGSLTPSMLGGTNYAVGGARSRYHNFDVTLAGLPPPDPADFYSFSLLGQLDQYHSDHGTMADPNALYVVWGGSNDIQDVLALAGAGDVAGAQNRLTQAIDDIATVVLALVADGVQHLLVPTVPDLGVVPAVKDAGAGSFGTFISQAFNDALDAVLSLLSADPDLSIVRFDVFDLVQDMVNNPGSYGFTNVDDPCLQNFYVASVLNPSQDVSICGNPEQHMFWDIVHPSASTHEILAQGMARAVPEPHTLALFALGLAGIGVIRRKKLAA